MFCGLGLYCFTGREELEFLPRNRPPLDGYDGFEDQFFGNDVSATDLVTVNGVVALGEAAAFVLLTPYRAG